MDEPPAADGTIRRPREEPSQLAPPLSVAGFAGPLDFLVGMVRRHQIDLDRLSILALIKQFVAALEAARTHVKLERHGDWLVMASALLQFKA